MTRTDNDGGCKIDELYYYYYSKRSGPMYISPSTFQRSLKTVPLISSRFATRLRSYNASSSAHIHAPWKYWNLVWSGDSFSIDRNNHIHCIISIRSSKSAILLVSLYLPACCNLVVTIFFGQQCNERWKNSQSITAKLSSWSRQQLCQLPVTWRQATRTNGLVYQSLGAWHRTTI